MNRGLLRLSVISAIIQALLCGFAHGQTGSSGEPLTLDAAIDYAKQHSPLLAATQQSVLTKQAAIAAAKAEQLPRVDADAALRGGNQLTESALGFPLTPLADIPNQPFENGHLTGLATATVPIYTGGRIGAETHVAEAERDLAQMNVHDVESNLEYEVAGARQICERKSCGFFHWI